MVVKMMGWPIQSSFRSFNSSLIMFNRFESSTCEARKIPSSLSMFIRHLMHKMHQFLVYNKWWIPSYKWWSPYLCSVLKYHQIPLPVISKHSLLQAMLAAGIGDLDLSFWGSHRIPQVADASSAITNCLPRAHSSRWRGGHWPVRQRSGGGAVGMIDRLD